MKRSELFLSVGLAVIAIPFFMVGDMYGMELSYYKSCRQIYEELENEKQKFFTKIMHDEQINIQQELQGVEQKLQAYKKKLHKEKQHVLCELKKAFVHDDDIWETIVKIVYDIKNHFKNKMQMPSRQTTYSERISPELLNTITKWLQLCNIEPSSISIDEVYYDQSGTMNTSEKSVVACAESPIWSYVIEKDLSVIINTDGSGSGKITFFPKFYELSLIRKKATCIHEIGHIVCQHGIVWSAFLSLISAVCCVSKDVINASKQFRDLIVVQEKEADMLLALEHHDVAVCMAEDRYCDCHPALFDASQDCAVNHYHDLCSIKILGEQHIFLEKIKKAIVEESVALQKAVREGSI